MASWHTKPIPEITKELGINPELGLSQEEAEVRLKRDGLNELPKGKQLQWWQLLIRQFASPLIYLLVIAAAITAAIAWHEFQTPGGEDETWVDTLVISIAVLVNVAISFYQEFQAGNIFKALAGIVTVTSRIVRGGNTRDVDSRQIAQGDVILLAPGMKIPADARLFAARDLEVNEALLTGESSAVKKRIGEVSEEAGLGDRANMVFMGTTVERGEGRAVVIATGAKTELGQIAQLTQEAGEGQKTPLQERVERLGKTLTVFISIGAAFIFVAGIFHDRPIVESFVLAVAVAVAGIPEGLPAALAVVLTISMRAIYRKNGLAKNLLAAETLGSTSVICTDKTGTLTEGVMKLEELVAVPGKEEALWEAFAFANEAIIEKDEKGERRIVGESTDRAKLEAFLAAGNDFDALLARLPRVTTLPFSSEHKYLASFHQSKSGIVVYVSGAPEILLERVKGMAPEELTRFRTQVEEFASRGYRMIAAGKIELHTSDKDLTQLGEADLDKYITGIEFLGIAAIRDPIRPDVLESLKLTREAGVRVVMITGDHALTAKAIGKELGFRSEAVNVMEGSELDRLSPEELKQRIPHVEIFARVNPAHKMQIVDAWQAHGQAVAMTGDGVNDAPALKAADIGIAVGAGTDVTKEAADLVLLNDSFTTITEAIKQGRIAFDNIRKVVLRLLTDSFTEVLIVMFALIVNVGKNPITAGMILWTNLVEDAFPSFALAFEPGEKDVMKRPPLKRGAKVLNRESFTLLGLAGLATDLLLIGIFYYLATQTTWTESYIQTIIFTILGSNTLFFMYSLKSLRQPIWKLRLFGNRLLNFAVLFGFGMILVGVYAPFANKLIGTTPIHIYHLLFAFGFSVVQIAIMELVKWAYRTFKFEVNENELINEIA